MFNKDIRRTKLNKDLSFFIPGEIPVYYLLLLMYIKKIVHKEFPGTGASCTKTNLSDSKDVTLTLRTQPTIYTTKVPLKRNF